MAPLVFREWINDNICHCEIVAIDKLTKHELEDIANRQMIIKTDKGLYKIISTPTEQYGKTLYNGLFFRTYYVKVESK